MAACSALALFHAAHPAVGAVVNVTRRPYSFNGDRTTVPDGAGLAGAGTPEGEEPTWHESWLGYCGGERLRANVCAGLLAGGGRSQRRVSGAPVVRNSAKRLPKVSRARCPLVCYKTLANHASSREKSAVCT